MSPIELVSFPLSGIFFHDFLSLCHNIKPLSPSLLLTRATKSNQNNAGGQQDAVHLGHASSLI